MLMIPMIEEKDFDELKIFVESEILPLTSEFEFNDRNNIRNQIRYSKNLEDLVDKIYLLNERFKFEIDPSDLIETFNKKQEKEKNKEEVIIIEDKPQEFHWNDPELKEEYKQKRFDIKMDVGQRHVIKIDLAKPFPKRKGGQGEYYYIDDVEFIEGFPENKEKRGNESYQFAKGTLKAIQEVVEKYNGEGTITLEIERITKTKTKVKELEYKK